MIISAPDPEQIRDKLISMFPSFEEQWKENGDDWKDKNGSFTLHGLFSEFSRFIRLNFQAMPDSKQKELLEFIESCVTDNPNDDLDNAVCTCFLENLAGEPPLSAELRRFMGPKSKAFFDEWDWPKSV